jgi:hypothetical protein
MKKLRKGIEFEETHPLVRFANKMCGFYGHPVYLVGSQLTSDNPRDVDVVCIMSDEDFKMRWFPDAAPASNNEAGALQELIDRFYLGIHTGIHRDEHWYYYSDMVKKSLFGTKATYLPIDFKVEAKSYADTHYKDKPILRLDTRPY